MIRNIFFVVFSLLITQSALGQYKSTKLKMAEGLLEEGKIYAAIKIYEDIIKKDESNKYVIKKIAELNEQLFNYEEAAKWYYNLMEVQEGEYPKAEFKFAQLTKLSGNYELAIKHFDFFNKTYKGHDKASYSSMCKNEIKSCEAAMKALPNADYTVIRLPNNINSSYTDLAPFGFKGKLYYSAIPLDTAFTYTEYLDSAPAFQIYVANQVEDEQFDSVQLFIPEILNESFKHSSNACFNEKGDQFFFTRCKENVNGKNICMIYCSELKEGKWTEPTKLGNDVNDANNDFSSTHPTLLSYRKSKRDKQNTNLLIFSSNRSGGEGGYDLYSIELNSDLSTGKLSNLGSKINSVLDDVTPFYNGKDYLYFSSNGNGGLGGFDVFKVPVKKGKLKKIQDVDIPINSSWDDWYYNEMSSSTAFIVSNRKTSRSYYNNVSMDDIYLIKKETKKFLVLTAVENDSSENNISGVSFKVKFADDTKTEGKVVKVGESIQIVPNMSYEIIAQKNDYINERTFLSTSDDTKSDTINWEFKLTKIDTTKDVVLNNIYFEENSADLTPPSKVELNKLFQILLTNPEFSIEIGAHTDDQGTKEENLILSEKRAQSVVNYLVSKGIGKSKLTAIGYGESKPIAGNKNSNGSVNEEGRKLNRRITFKIITVQDIPSPQ